MSEEFIKVTDGHKDTRTHTQTEPLPELLSELKNICRLTWPGAQVGLVPNVPPEVGPEVRCLLVDLAAVGVVAQVHGRLPGGPAGVYAQRTPTLLTLAPTRSLQLVTFNTHHSSIRSSSDIISKWQRYAVRIPVSLS